MSDLDYSKPEVPGDYKCRKCGAIGLKLWRAYGDFGPIDLLCAVCAAEQEKKDITGIDALGIRQQDGIKLDQIGWYVPAVPTENGIGYWGYGAIPAAGLAWWQKLPTLKVTVLK